MAKILNRIKGLTLIEIIVVLLLLSAMIISFLSVNSASLSLLENMSNSGYYLA
jgi:competence protein ComGC